ncbi:MAG: hypothetical protein JXQ83_07455, partial [Candidatus Glassbacteria bacterium]|nr:hypothetical protein [Candidatus Glassbacteria bacterium]
DPGCLRRMETAALGLSSPGVMENFVRSVESEFAGERPARQAQVSRPALPERDFDPTVLAYLSSDRVVAYALKATGGKSPEELAGSPVIETLRYFADGYLVSGSWRVRNNGVKLVGILRYGQRRDLLLSLVADRSPAPLIKRLLGADFRQVGFIRRNALVALGRLELWDDRLGEVLAGVLQNDPYFESRSAAAGVILALRAKIGASPELARALEKNLGHRSPEVRWKSLEALGAVTPDPKLTANLDRFLFHPNWRIRQALAMAVGHLVERGLVHPGDPLIRQVESIIPTCTDFIPTFPLKRELVRMHRLGRGGSGENTTHGESRP